MSLNEIYDNPVDNSTKDWQNYRVNNLNIAQNFNVDIAGASPGDVLQLDGSLNYTWVPYSSTVTQPLEYAKALFVTNSVPPGQAGTLMEFGSISGSPSFTIVSGEIVSSEDASLILFVNITCVPSQFSLPMFSVVKYSTTGNTTLMQISPYLTTLGTQFTSCNAIMPVQVTTGDRIAVIGYTVGNSSQASQLVTAESNVNILRLN